MANKDNQTKKTPSEDSSKTKKKSAPADNPVTKKTAASKPAATSAKKAAATPSATKNATKAEEKPVKREKTQKQPEETTQAAQGGSEKGGVKALFKNKKLMTIVTAAVAFVLVTAIVIGIIAGTKSCNTTVTPPVNSKDPGIVVSDDKPLANELKLLSPVDVSDPATAELLKDAYKDEYSATTQVGYNGKVLGETDRIKPVAETKDDRDQFSLGEDVENAIAAAGSVRYPKYGYTMSSVLGSTEARDALINESDWLTAYGTRNNSGNGSNGDGTYNMMDENGYLYFVNNGTTTPAVNPDGSHRRLYKHSAADGMYYGGINAANPELSDDEPGIVKRVTLRPRGYGSYSVTGVYAPAGEVIKIEMSEADMDATGGITVHIGQALYNGQSNNIWTAKGQMQRFPNILNTMVVNKNTAKLENGVYTAYVGSFIGGPLYIRNTNATFTATISGGVRYSHFILGYTTKEEFEENKASTTPYFDLEVWNYGVLHSGPKLYAQSFSYDDLYKAAVLWEKVSSVTTTGSSQGIVFLYDPFVAAGAAVAFPGRSSVNCPAGWMSGSLNYNAIVTSGSWGNFHEYHHNFQGYGVGNGGEVTNNGMTLVSYALFTKISSKRGMGAYGAQGLGGWNNYTSATWALNDLLSLQHGGHPSNGDQGLAIYSVLLHNFGANNYIQAKVTQQRSGYGQSYAGYMRGWEAQTHNDMTYFFKDVLKGITSDVADEYHNPEYKSMFVPVSCVYQTGRSYMYDGEKKYFNTMQPYMIAANQTFDIDLRKYNAPEGQYASGSIVIPDGFSYKVKSVTKPARGSIKVNYNGIINYTPAADAKTGDTSGQIIVTLEITKDDGAFKVDDVDLVLEFEISQEMNKMVLQRTIYSYDEGTAYTDAQQAFESNFAGYTDKLELDHTNPVQNANTDIWAYPDNEQNRNDHADAPEHYFASDNQVSVIDGKLYFEEDGKYRIYLRGRVNCAAYFSLDGESYKIGAKVTKGNGAAFYTTDANTYFDVEFDEGNVTVTVNCEGEKAKEYTYKITPDQKGETTNWLYVKEILIVQSKPLISYIGLGYGAWTTPLYRMVEKYYDANGKEVASPEAEGYDHSGTVYYDSNDREVPAEVVAAAKPVPPTSATYINAYRSSYDFPDNTSFESDYFYTRSYNCNYIGTPEILTSKYTQTYMSEISNYVPWNNDNELLNIQNLFDGDTSTNIHSHNNFLITESNPAIIAFDMGAVVKANSLSLSVYTGNNLGWRAFPKILKLEGSLDGENWFEMGTWSNLSAGANSGKDLTFPEKQFRYYKISVTKSNWDASARFALSELSLSYTLRITGNGANLIAPTNENVIFSKNWESRVAVSSFGRILVGNKGDKVNFEFTGTRLAILTSDGYGKNFDVYIDGKKVSSVDVVEHDGVYGITFLSEKLTNGKHKVEIRCTGEANIDSFAIFDEDKEE